MRLKSSSYSILQTNAERRDFFADLFTRNARSLDVRRGVAQSVFQECTFDAYKTSADVPEQVKAKMVCERFADRLAQRVVEGPNSGIGLLMQGEPGTGKTHLAMAVLNRLRGFFDFMRRKDDGDNTYGRRMQNFSLVSVLVIDEIGRSSITDFERKTLRDLYERRFESGVPTILITNLDSDELSLALDATFTSRLNKYAYQLLFEWEDHRRKTSVFDLDPEEIF